MKFALLPIYLLLLVFNFTGINALESGILKPGGYSEQIVLHTDRDIYITGEKVWFKASCNSLSDDNDSLLSRILYVEIYDQHNNPVARSKFGIQKNTATGSLTIPPDVHTGYYYIRAYTQFLRNYPVWIYPAKLLTLINPGNLSTEQSDANPNQVMIVPEGGKLFTGVTSRIALGISAQLAENIQSAQIKDDQGSEIADVRFLPNGLALVMFTPQGGKNYTLFLTGKGGQVLQKPFPAIYQQGILMTASCNKYSLNIALHHPAGEIPADVSDEYLVEMRSTQFGLLMSRAAAPGKAIDISLDQVPHGFVYLILKDNTNKIVSIQAVYVPEKKHIEIDVETPKSAYKPREYISLTINQPNGIIAGTGLLTVVPEHSQARPVWLPIHAAGNPGLMQNMLNHADLTDTITALQIMALLQLGYPAFNSAEFKAALDQKSALEWLPEMRDAGISGQVVEKKTRRPLPDVLVYAAAINGNQQVHIYKTKADGKFYFTLNHLAHMHHVYVCPKPVDTLDMELMINSDFTNAYPSVPFYSLYVDSTMKRLIDQLYRNNQVGKTFPRFAEKTIEKPNFLPLPDRIPAHSVTLSDYIEMPVMQEVFSEIVPFTTVHQKDKQFVLNLYDDETYTTLTDPLVLLDGIPVFDLNQIMTISPDQVEKISIINKQVYLGEHTLAGIIDIKTKTNNFAGMSFPETSEFIEYQAISPTTIPVFPEHKTSGVADRNPDFRNLLYWDPFVTSEKSNTGFYAPDNCGLYKITINASDGKTRYYGNRLLRISR
ncbi:MAG: hypothetical protein JXQ80_05975 [Bacteroidales bacterium]|nr:hypothetical protein [Bacteroidales bacterium]